MSDKKKKKNNLPAEKHKSVSYAKWGYIFIAPFFITYIFWSLIPQFLTIFYSFFEYHKASTGVSMVGPNFVGLANYVKLFTPDKNGVIDNIKYAGNTMIMWIGGAIPQFLVALLLAVWFTSLRLNIKGQGFFKTVMYMPNLIMASAFSMLFFTLFGAVGPINQLLQAMGVLEEKYYFFDHTWSVRALVMLMNFLMWFGNTTIVLMAGIMGIDQSLFEAAAIDGASSTKVFFKVTLPLLMPIMTYAFITALIGGINMYDVPTILTNGSGEPNGTAKTLIMYLQNHLSPSKNYGMGGAISVVIFIFAGILSLIVYKFLVNSYQDKNGEVKPRKKKKGGR